MDIQSGTLYVVGTPIGNLEDITLRALDVLKNVDICLTEDTRRTKKLFARYNIATKMMSCYRFNELSRIAMVTEQLKQGKSFALVSDAGMPGISDPGERLIRQIISDGIPVEVISGPSSVIHALIVSGLRMDRFTFEGFLPRKGSKRNKRLAKISADTNTVILFESAVRLASLVRDVYTVCGDRHAAVCRELTKKFEQVVRGKLSELIDKIKKNELTLKGELVVVIDGKESFEKKLKKDA